MKYIIYHPFGGSVNHQCISGQFEYQQVATVEADNLNNAFFKSQNDFNEDYAMQGIRSTSVGDIIQDADTQSCHLIKGTGFQEVSNYWLRHIDWGNHMTSEKEKD